MPVGRIVLKAISESKKLSALKTDGARLLYTWLIPHLNVNGCFSSDPVVISGRVFTRLGKSVGEISGYLDDLENNHLIIRYSIDGDDFLIMPNFKEKQPSLHPEREGKINIPLPTQDQLLSKSGLTQDQVLQNINKDKLNINKVKENICANGFARFWKSYPKKKSKGQAEKSFLKINPDEQLLDLMLSKIEQAKKSEDWIKEKGKYIPHPATWLNAKGWEDEECESLPSGGIIRHQGIKEWLNEKKGLLENAIG